MANAFVERDKVMDICFGEFCALGDEAEQTLNAVIEKVKALPAADARLVVTCEECEWHYDNGEHWCKRWKRRCPDDAEFFCAYGKRRMQE